MRDWEYGPANCISSSMSRPVQPVTFVVVTSPPLRAQAVTEVMAIRTANHDRIRCLVGGAQNSAKERTSPTRASKVNFLHPKVCFWDWGEYGKTLGTAF